jgi:PAS domain S-box-containing protein
MAGRTISTNKALRKIVEAATSTLELEDLLKSILTTLKEVTGADSASILLEEQGKVMVKAGLGIGIEEEMSSGFALNPGEGLAGDIFLKGEPLYVEDVTLDPRVVNPYLKAYGVRSYLGVPINNRGEIIGVLHIDWNQIHKYTQRELGLLTIVADRCGAAIANARQHAKLKEAEAKFRNLFENISGTVGIARVIRDSQGRVVDWEVSDINKIAEKMTGVTQQNAVGRRATEVWGEETARRAIVLSDSVMASRKPIQFESSRWKGVHLVSSLFPISEDQIAWVGLDITELKNKERELAETSSYLENLLDYANAPIIVWDSDLQITKFNHAFEHLTGFNSIEMIGKKLDVLFPESNREVSMEHIRQTSTGAHWESVEIPILCSNGEVRVVLWNSATIFHPGTEDVLATIAQGQDITDRKKAEMALAEASSYLENLIDHANAPIIVWDPDFKIVRFNHAFEHLTGMKAPNVLGKDLDLLFPATSRQDTMEKIHRTSTGEHWESVEIPIQRFDGTTRLVLWNSATIFSPGTNSVFATIAQGQDITARKDAERELMRSNAELEQFAYVASHDLKEPLRMISGFLELLQLRYKGKIDADADEFIRFAIDGANRMNWLIEDLLQFSRIGRASWKPEQTSMQDAYQQALGNLAAQLRETNARITSGELPTIFADRLQMTTLLQNLIGNAIKFRSQARPEVEVLAKRESGGWTFSVRDNGIGFPMEYSEKIFVLFERLHSKEKYPGTGIGLAICKKIVERHGGRIWAESKEGEGSTFYFFIPDNVGVSNEPSK